MRTFVLGDVHGNYRALQQVIERSGIDKENDMLIVLGDVVDGYPDVVDVIEELLTFKNHVYVAGNHDFWCNLWMKTGNAEESWLVQGGANTFKDYISHPEMQKKHEKLYFYHMQPYYYDADRDYIFVHGGFDWHIPIEENSEDDIMWDRHMVKTAQTWQINHDKRGVELQVFPFYNKIFVGHTDTRIKFDGRYEPSDKPQFLSNLINMDTGAGWEGKLSIMDVDTFEYWQSDSAKELYPEGHKREATIVEMIETFEGGRDD